MLFERFRRTLEPFNNRKIFLGFSGGADSTLLAHWTVRAVPSVKLVHFEHGIRGEESLLDAEFCRKTAQQLKAEFQQIPLNVLENRHVNESLELAARRLRLEQWQQLSRNNSGEKVVILLGHHADDRVENLLLKLMRGGNLTSVGAFNTIREFPDFIIVRPLLFLTKEEIFEQLKLLGVDSWCEDRTNSENICPRNYLRNTLLPGLYAEIPPSRPGFRRAMDAIAQDADFLEKHAEKLFQSGSVNQISYYRELHPAMAIRVLRRFVCRELEQEITLSGTFLRRFQQLIAQDPPWQLPLPPNWKLYAANGTLKLCADTSPIPEAMDQVWQWKLHPVITFGNWTLKAELFSGTLSHYPNTLAAFAVHSLPEELQLTTRRAGDRLETSDRIIHRVKKLFNENKIPLWDRQNYPLLRKKEQILWIPGIRRNREALSHLQIAEEKQIVLFSAWETE